MHPGDDSHGALVRPQSFTRPVAGRIGGESLPVHRVRGHLPRRPASGRHVGRRTLMRSAISPLDLLRPRTVRDALQMLRDHEAIAPLAGCTDLYVALNFGTLTTSRFLDIWPL